MRYLWYLPQRRVSTQFLVFPISTRDDITVYGLYFITITLMAINFNANLVHSFPFNVNSLPAWDTVFL